MNFRMYAKVKMNRCIDRDKDIISAGGYTIESEGRQIDFDFMDYEIVIDKTDSSIAHIYGSIPDFECFPEAETITLDTLKHISKFIEFFVYTGETIESDLIPQRLLECSFEVLDPVETILLPTYVCNESILSCSLR